MEVFDNDKLRTEFETLLKVTPKNSNYRQVLYNDIHRMIETISQKEKQRNHPSPLNDDVTKNEYDVHLCSHPKTLSVRELTIMKKFFTSKYSCTFEYIKLMNPSNDLYEFPDEIITVNDTFPIVVPKGIMVDKENLRWINPHVELHSMVKNLRFSKILLESVRDEVFKYLLSRHDVNINQKSINKLSNTLLYGINLASQTMEMTMNKVFCSFIGEVKNRIPVTFRTFVNDLWIPILKNPLHHCISSKSIDDQQQRNDCIVCFKNETSCFFTSCQHEFCLECACRIFWNSSFGLNKKHGVCPLCKNECKLSDLRVNTTANKVVDWNKYITQYYVERKKVKEEEKEEQEAAEEEGEEEEEEELSNSSLTTILSNFGNRDTFQINCVETINLGGMFDQMQE